MCNWYTDDSDMERQHPWRGGWLLRTLCGCGMPSIAGVGAAMTCAFKSFGLMVYASVTVKKLVNGCEARF